MLRVQPFGISVVRFMNIFVGAYASLRVYARACGFVERSRDCVLVAFCYGVREQRGRADHRDPGPFITTHLYLLLGCALPVWLEGSARPDGGPPTLAALSGIVVLGMGDCAVSCRPPVWRRC